MLQERHIHWEQVYRELVKDIDRLAKQIGEQAGSIRVNKNLFFQEEIHAIENKIIQLLEDEVECVELFKEMFPKLEGISSQLTYLENTLPKLAYYFKTPYRIKENNDNTVMDSLVRVELLSETKIVGPQDVLSYFQSFPMSEYVLLRNGYRLLFIDHIKDAIKNVVRQNEEWEPEITELIKKYIKPNSTAIDVGAHIGIHTLSMSLFAKDSGKVIAFEPNPKIFRELMMNLSVNECQNVIAYCCALSDSTGTGELQIPFENEGGASIGTGPIQVCVTSLDLFNLKNVSFIKIDVENAEYQVLKGARQTILENRPVIILEIMARKEPDRLRKMLKIFHLLIFELGYILKYVGNKNYLAIPAENKSLS